MKLTSLTYEKRHMKTYAIGLIVASNKTVNGIATYVLSIKSERSLNKDPHIP